MTTQIQDKIDEIINKSNLPKEGNIDVFELAKENGFTVGNAYFPHHEDGYLAIKNIDGRKQLCIGVNMFKPQEMKRYIVAYIMGIYFTRGEDEDLYVGKIDLGSRREENEADCFVRTLLLPERPFKTLYENLGLLCDEESELETLLSTKFNVPKEIISIRKEELTDVKNKTQSSQKTLAKTSNLPAFKI